MEAESMEEYKIKSITNEKYNNLIITTNEKYKTLEIDNYYFNGNVMHAGGTATGRAESQPNVQPLPPVRKDSQPPWSKYNPLRKISFDTAVDALSEMCGNCIGVAFERSHDPHTMKRRICQLCGTDWQGIEPENRRREAIMAQRKRNGRKTLHAL